MKPHLSIRSRLAASATVLVVAVVAVVAAVVYSDVRHSAISAAGQHAENVSRRLSDMYAQSARQVLGVARATARDSALRGFLAERSSERAASAKAAIAGINRTGNTVAAVELWDSAGRRLLTTRDTVPPLDSVEARGLVTLAAENGGAAIGWLHAPAGRLGYVVIAAVAVRGTAPTGYYVERRTLTGSPQSSAQLRDLVGAGTTLLVGNARADLWTDFVKPAPLPPVAVSDAKDVVEYERPRGNPVLASITPIPSTPWAIEVDYPVVMALAPVHAMLGRLALLTLLSVIVAAAGAWAVSGTLTRPIARLVTVAEGMSAGDESERVRVDRLDELGVLGTAFNAMAERITRSRSSLEQTVAELKDAESRYHMLFDASPQSTWVYDLETFAFLAVNAAAVQRYGYSEAEFLSMTILDLHSRDDVPALLDTLKQLGANGEARMQLWNHRAKSGARIDVEISSRALTFAGRRARLVVAHDLTERRRAEASAIAAQERLERVIGSSGAVLYELRVDERGTALEWMSDNVTRILGYELGELQNPRWWPDNVHPDDRERLVSGDGATQYVDGASEYRFRHKQGSYRWLRADQRVLSCGNGARKVVGTWLDITEQRQLEDRLRQTQKMEAVGRLAGGVAHDFNNLLAVISGFTEMLISGRRPGDPDLEPLSEVKSAAARAAGLTRQLLAFSRQQVLRPHDIDINAVVSDAEKMLSRLASDDVILTTRLDPSLALVRADPGQVQQVLMNLVVNARDAMPDGGTITIETHPAELDESFGVGAGADLGRYVALVVADTGTGMPPDIRDQIFEPFFTTKEPGKGTGLGLSTVQGIVEQSGGRIFVYSEPDQGTTFKIYLPSADAVATKNPAPAPAPRTPNSAASESILLVEDDAAVRKVTSSILSKAGYSVVEAINGAAGLAACADRAVSIDLVLTDMVMPQMGGRELATGVRRERPGTPIVFMSGYARTSIGDEELVANERFVEKPFTAEALLRAVREMLDRAPAARSA